ncbi:MAG: hypothetical protein JO340_13870 [Acidobacteriaceae bacterium]|nr:hypothetical protein [Acidobacteriaceae bacterium]
MVISGTTPTSSDNLTNALSNLTSAPTSKTSSDASTSTTSSSSTSDDLASEQTFLQLFVAQLQNQDPLDPNQQDPTQMVSELAQFSELEQLVNIGQNVQSIDQAVAPASASPSSSDAAPSTPGNNAAAVAGSGQNI